MDADGIAASVDGGPGGLTAPSRLAARLRDRDWLRLLMAKMPCEAQIEIAAHSGFDAVIVDCEHGAGGGLQLEQHLRAAAAAHLPGLVRVPGLEPGAILAALDAGALGVVVPHILDASQAEAAVEAAHYPPRGRRGLALSTRAGGYGTVSVREHLRRAARDTIVVVQIEDAEAVTRAAEILSVEGVDAVLVGLTDLSASLGHAGEASHPDLAAAVGRIIAAAQAAGVAVAAVVSTPEAVTDSRRLGATASVFVATELIAQAFRRAAAVSAGGQPEALVLLPGMLATADLWGEVAPELRSLIPIRTARIDLDDSVEEMAETVLADAPGRFALAGHSLGAVVALEVVRRAPARVTRLALLNASAGPGSDDQRRHWVKARSRVEKGAFEELAVEFARTNLSPLRDGDAALVARVETMARQVGREGCLRQLSAQLGRPDSRPWLQAIACPTVVLSGANDQISEPSLQDELARAIPGARLERLAGCGHMSPLEAPAEVSSALKGWLS